MTLLNSARKPFLQTKVQDLENLQSALSVSIQEYQDVSGKALYDLHPQNKTVMHLRPDLNLQTGQLGPSGWPHTISS